MKPLLYSVGLIVGGLALATLLGAYGADKLWRYIEARR